MKSRWLQKTKWYCQMYQKQCRDENGFKCHWQSEGHKRMIELYSSNPEKYQNKFSNQFLHKFLQILEFKYCDSQVKTNNVYNEYIQDKNHIHMNSTRWKSLTCFVTYLQSNELVEVEEKEDGPYIKLITNKEVKKNLKKKKMIILQ